MSANGTANIIRLPPQNLEAERGALGSALLHGDVLHDIVPILKAEDFYRDTHQILFRVIRDLYDGAQPVDAITVGEELVRRGEYDKFGGDEALAEIANSVPHAANGAYYAQIVRQKAIQRGLIAAAAQVIDQGYSNTLSSDELLELAEQLVFRIAEENTVGDTADIRAVLAGAMEQISLRSEQKHPLTGVGTGYFDLDDMTAGFQPNQLVILAARPSIGKTALALNICDHVATTHKAGVLFVSLEMGGLELGERLLASRARIDSNKIRTGRGLGTRELADLGSSYLTLREAPIYIDDTPARNVLQIASNARRLKLRKGLGLIVVDYIQLIGSENDRDSRQEQIAKISRRLKALARELKVPVIALSQLNREVERREDRRPRMADLRESGAIEQDADLVLLLHRPDYYDPNDQPGIAELIVAKNRSGATGTVKLKFFKNYTRFENLSETNDPPDGGPF